MEPKYKIGQQVVANHQMKLAGNLFAQGKVTGYVRGIEWLPGEGYTYMLNRDEPGVTRIDTDSSCLVVNEKKVLNVE